VPLLTFAFAILHGQERFQVQGLIGALIALGGVAVVVADQLDAAVPLVSLLLGGVAFTAESGVTLKWPAQSDAHRDGLCDGSATVSSRGERAPADTVHTGHGARIPTPTPHSSAASATT
jgi:drug/metabolite transporter (DMT)-like permease